VHLGVTLPATPLDASHGGSVSESTLPKVPTAASD